MSAVRGAMIGGSALHFLCDTLSKYLMRSLGGRYNKDERGSSNGQGCFSGTVDNMLPSGISLLYIQNTALFRGKNRKNGGK